MNDIFVHKEFGIIVENFYIFETIPIFKHLSMIQGLFYFKWNKYLTKAD